ncbi:MAG TPA: DUF2141 domain-containing protein [Allosphingosinicella sp.]|jgi:uncharacterized protein (DUF2141 family)
MNLRTLLSLPLLALLPAAAAPASNVEIKIEKLRNAKGVVHLCLTANAAFFPDCAGDPKAKKKSVAASNAGSVTIPGVAPGAYALSVFHDENGNTKFDTFLKIPKEGFGFSRNPTVRFGAPKFAQVRFEVGGGIARQTVRMQYLL